MFTDSFSPKKYFEHGLLLLITPNDLHYAPEFGIEIHAYYSPSGVISTNHLALMTQDQIEAVEELARGHWLVIKGNSYLQLIKCSGAEELDRHFQEVRTMYRNLTNR